MRQETIARMKSTLFYEITTSPPAPRDDEKEARDDKA